MHSSRCQERAFTETAGRKNIGDWAGMGEGWPSGDMAAPAQFMQRQRLYFILKELENQ